MKTYHGQCECGNVHYEFQGEPIKAVFCYCADCQKTTGSDKWFGIWVPKDNLKFTKGTPGTYTRMGLSGKEVHKKFCKDCGGVLGAMVDVAGFYSMAVTTLTDEHSFTPEMAIYTAYAQPWAVFPDEVPKFDTFPDLRP